MSEANDEFLVYKAWPIEQVREALDEFRKQMYSGAGSDELAAGLLCFDFITRRTDLPHSLKVMIDASCEEARMRSELIRQAEAFVADDQQETACLQKAVQQFAAGLKAVTRIINNPPDPERVRQIVRQRTEQP